MEARLPLDKLIRTKEALHELSRKKSATLKELQSLIGTLEFACRVVLPGRAFLQRIISLTKGISNSRWQIKLNTEFRKDIPIRLAFLEHWNGISFFLGDTVLSSPDLQLFTDALGSLGYGGYLNGQWFQSHWLPQHSLNPVTGISMDWQELFAIIFLAFSAVPTGRVNVYVSGVTTYPLSPSLILSILSHPGSWIWFTPLPF